MRPQIEIQTRLDKYTKAVKELRREVRIIQEDRSINPRAKILIYDRLRPELRKLMAKIGELRWVLQTEE